MLNVSLRQTSVCSRWIYREKSSAASLWRVGLGSGDKSWGRRGLVPITTSKGERTSTPIHRAVVSKFYLREKQVSGSMMIRHQATQKVTKLRMTALVWPSVWGWKGLENFSFVPILAKLANKFSIPVRNNCLGQSMTTDHHREKEGCDFGRIISFCARKKMCHLWKSIQNMESWPCTVHGRPRTKSILISPHGWPEMGSGLYNPAFVLVPLDSWHVRHLLITVKTSLEMGPIKTILHKGNNFIAAKVSR